MGSLIFFFAVGLGTTTAGGGNERGLELTRRIRGDGEGKRCGWTIGLRWTDGKMDKSWKIRILFCGKTTTKIFQDELCQNMKSNVFIVFDME